MCKTCVAVKFFDFSSRHHSCDLKKPRDTICLQPFAIQILGIEILKKLFYYETKNKYFIFFLMLFGRYR